ncbi:uncharacterized protein RSE6_05150 [Rhynchosporium secalis]|uniref:UBZ4-type domain-containing protein n=1 Tax=Rhynchosporium secalis TaxID=38038 RepID=A0A1E1M723_RHYSE|nr:uncharacterized protein RSE6_05150 [Rhynchosporium secalis]
MNSSRHANRAGRGEMSTRGRGQGRGNRQRGGSNDRPNFSPGPSNVPTTQHVIPGASVSIILKIDQPTGRQVQGTVAELLTRGNHPRGIKVRLQDGRVGRVQKMASEEEARTGSAGMSGLGRNGEASERVESGGLQISNMGGQSGGFATRTYGDYRLHDPDQPPASELSLEDYVVTKGQKKNRRVKSTLDSEAMEQSQIPASDGTTLESATTVCPVCGEFEGDEVAVAHHVNAHFD